MGCDVTGQYCDDEMVVRYKMLMKEVEKRGLYMNACVCVCVCVSAAKMFIINKCHQIHINIYKRNI